MPLDKRLTEKYHDDLFDLLRRSIDFYISVETGASTRYTRNRRSVIKSIGFVLVLLNVALIFLCARYLPETWRILPCISVYISIGSISAYDERIPKDIRRFINTLHSLQDYDPLVRKHDPLLVLGTRERLEVYDKLLTESSERDWQLPFYFYSLLD